jgi:Lactonase, 7-bladed beta-propeller
MTRRTLSLAALALPIAGSAAEAHAAGAIYALTNSPSGNAVIVYDRGADGSLTPTGSFATGGTGTGAGLGSQGAVIVSDDYRLLFPVNAGSNSVSSFRIQPSGLELIDTAPSGGIMPTSVAFRSGLLYVLNAGVPNNVSGLLVSSKGELTPLAGSERPLSAASTSPAQVGFSDDGSTLIVTERATDLIDTFPVGEDGTLSGPFMHPSAGPTPFGFAVDKRNTLFVSEAGTGGGASTYRVESDAGLTPKSSMIMTAPIATIEHGRSRVLPLQAVDRGRRGTRLLDDDGGRTDRGPLGRSAGGLGAPARDRRLFRRAADLCLAPIDHVLAPVLLLLRASEEELPRSVCVPWSHPEGSSGAIRRSRIEVQDRSRHSHQAPGRGGGTHHRLAAGSLRTV